MSARRIRTAYRACHACDASQRRIPAAQLRGSSQPLTQCSYLLATKWTRAASLQTNLSDNKRILVERLIVSKTGRELVRLRRA